MATQLLVSLLTILIIGVTSEPAPGRIPKVYNALITSSQNLEPSKAYPVYQPVLHDAFAFSYQPAVFYGGDFLGNGLLPSPALFSKGGQPLEAQSPSSTAAPPVTSDSTPSDSDAVPSPSEPPKQEPDNTTPNSLTPPVTQSPIPLNEFGLPPQVIPLGPVNSVYNALPQFNPFAYRYPSLRFYDPYEPFSYSPYASLPSIYRPVTNVLDHHLPVYSNKGAAEGTNAPQTQKSALTPPPEPSDLNILNYSATDTAIPNVPPPPLPQGGLKSSNSER